MAKVQPTFEVRFAAPGLLPEKVPLRAVSDALSAIQDLASGRDPFETQSVPQEKAIGLLKVKRGSAIYSCVARDPEEALSNLSRVGSLISDSTSDIEKGLVAALRPLESLCEVAKALKGSVSVTLAREKEPLFVIEEDVYERISSHVFLTGDTTVIGTIERAGGATEMRCLLRVAGRRKILYCDVETKDLARRLGQHLYEEIAATGLATWIHSSWRLHKFKIRDFTQPRLGTLNDAIGGLRKAGLKAWDTIEDPESLVKDLRS